ncbi:methylamine utilization protein MauJ [Sphingosinicella sp. LY1275]|uniref:methylamine utilization protein MauJ n=1 Tax=Sphingosinicella sp. LY1275 TaxID=3095379 RepID=UPI002ADEBA5C|nr:methylamine utilization protein MauJ [Sphingosinicella sp. LY1275]MEA1015338.1 hypothetical protein [Sphingosinicella sp. LY1275]
MVGAEIPELAEVLRHPLLATGAWVVANVDTHLAWTVRVQRVEYRGAAYIVLPVTRESYPAVATLIGAESRSNAKRRLMRFLSALSWSESSGMTVVGFGGGSSPVPMHREKTRGFAISHLIHFDYLPEPQDDAALLALALMREGRGLHHPAYSFLSFYRVLERAIPAKQRGAWVDAHLNQMPGRRAKEALAALRASDVTDVPNHIYKTRRQAIAHATGKGPVVDPDDPEEAAGLEAEYPIMEGLAELAIEEAFGVQTRSTQFREHKYELAGFRTLLGEGLVQRITSGAPPAAGEVVDIPELDIELAEREPFAPLQGMRPVHIHQLAKSARLTLQSSDALVEISFELDFLDERLRFDWQGNVKTYDDGSATAAANMADMTRFAFQYVGNGSLRIYDSEWRKLISRVDAFIPVNYHANHEWFEAEIQRWTDEAARRGLQGDLESSVRGE